MFSFIVFVETHLDNDELKTRVAVEEIRKHQKHILVVTDIIDMMFLSMK